MSLTEQDREWVAAIIKEAASDVLNASRDFTRLMVDGHAKACPNLRRLKWLCLGIGLGLGVSAPEFIRRVAQLL